MCGIVGAIYGPGGASGDEWSPSEAAELMFENVEHRGRDAFGWYHLTKDGRVKLRKYNMPATKGLRKLRPEAKTGIPDDVQYWVGHVRLATHGPANYTHNNHPILHKNTVGVHNGICYNYGTVLSDTGRQFKKAQVDSEAIFAAVDRYGIDKGLMKLDALAAFVFTDLRKPNTVYLGTADANPLVIAKTKHGSTYFAIEKWILDELKLELAEDMWQLDDYTILDITDGEHGKYRHWADPDERSYAGYGRWYSSGSSTYTPSTTGSSGLPLVVGSSPSTGTSTKSSEPGKGSGKVSLGEIECVRCGFIGTEEELELEDWYCPQCYSAEYLVDRDLADDDDMTVEEWEQMNARILEGWEKRRMEEDAAIVDKILSEA